MYLPAYRSRSACAHGTTYATVWSRAYRAQNHGKTLYEKLYAAVHEPLQEVLTLGPSLARVWFVLILWVYN